ncbi:unnamed protein product [Dovyalis caffra]|uniref:Secreted protein n=1 Tax=Dovyalis caffra TaxID=77055 RepID=A0AAV1R1R8_9ROSI|nr:unnamed protein product [Dovyalis caffra]
MLTYGGAGIRVCLVGLAAGVTGLLVCLACGLPARMNMQGCESVGGRSMCLKADECERESSVSWAEGDELDVLVRLVVRVEASERIAGREARGSYGHVEVDVWRWGPAWCSEELRVCGCRRMA